MMQVELDQDPSYSLSNVTRGIVVFYAVWCGDCKRSMEYEKKLSEEYAGKVKFYRMDAEKYESIADKYYVENYPTYVFFKKGVPDKGILVEPRSVNEVKKWIESKI